MAIQSELTQIMDNMCTLMDSMKFMSQQLVNDNNTVRQLREFFSSNDDVQKVNNLKFLRDQIAIYEASNPNINNITYLYINYGGLEKVNQTSLIGSQLPSPSCLLSSQNQITFYGPHETLSRVGHYLVISMVRKLSVTDTLDVYLYLESGYKKLGNLSTELLDRLGAVYTVISDYGKVVYSSDEKKIPFSSEVPTGNDIVLIDGKQYLPYKITSPQKWSLQIFVLKDSYKHYLSELSLGFFIIAVLATNFSIIISGLIWNSINRPFLLFEKNLKNIMTNDIEANIRKIHVEEFDKSIEYFENMRKRIIYLIQTVQQQEQEKFKLQLKQFLSKINPHFIHNTLDTLKWYSKGKGYVDVELFVSSLNRLLMYNMEKDEIATIKSELDAIDDYIALQKLKYDLDYKKELNIPEPMLQSEMPRFILQPLVENAIFHGLEGKGKICIRVNIVPNGKISIQILNDGHRLDIEKINRILRSAKDLSSNGIGIQYVIRMLQEKFRNTYEFNARVINDMNCIELVIPFCKGGYYAKSADSR
jgi:sensor histidine kinase YesM